MNDSTLQILLNKDLIAINQDPLGIQAERAIRADHYDVWVKPLSDGSKAIACLNRISGPVDVELNVKTVEGLSLDRTRLEEELSALFGGHSDISTTSNIYTHLDFSSKVSSANAIVNIFPENAKV